MIGSWRGAHRLTAIGRVRQRGEMRWKQGIRCYAQSGGAGPSSSIYLYDTMKRKKQRLELAGRSEPVKMYVCGVTVYDYSHIGHARVYVSFDLLFRHMQSKNCKVQYVRNITDIDDKIIARAAERNESIRQLSDRFIREFHTDMQSLNCLVPSAEPRATDYVQDMIEDIQKIVENGHGYASGGDVYFDVASFPAYGLLSGRRQEDNRPGERVAIDSRKRSAADFVLWKAAKEGEPHWESPWGPGRPGWHIECSAMIRRLMGPQIDVHGGGRDLVFPHHENELAQAAAAEADCSCCSPTQAQNLAQIWVHNGFVNVKDVKMSKSLGNFFTIRDILEVYHPLALRYFLLTTHYRAPVSYSSDNLDLAAERVYYLYQALLDCQGALAAGSMTDGETNLTDCKLEEALAGLDDDLNTQPALTALSEASKSINHYCSTKQGKRAKDRDLQLSSLWQCARGILQLLGLWQEDPSAVLQEMRAKVLSKNGMTEDDIRTAMCQRTEARQAKDFQRADKVRLDLAAKGIQIMDTVQGTTWRPVFQAEM